MMDDDELRDSSVRVCHKPGRVVGVKDDVVTVAVEVGGVHQHVLMARELAEQRAE